MKQLIEHIRKSIYGPEYYRELPAKPLSFSFKYYGGLAMLIALFLTILYSIPLVPLVTNTLRSLPQNFAAYYPDELTVPIVNGIATTTVPQPFYLPIPAIMKEQLSRELGVEHLGVIDVTSPVSLEKYREHRALFWIAQNALVVRDQKDGMRVSPFASNFNFTLSEKGILGVIGSFEPYFKFVLPVLVLAIFVGLCFAFAINLVYLLFPAFIIYAVMGIWKHKWTFGTAFQVCLHATTLPLLLSALLSLFGFNLGSLPFASTLLLLVMVFINIRINESGESAPVDEPAPPPHLRAPQKSRRKKEVLAGNNMQKPIFISVGFGVAAALLFLASYFAVLTLVSGWDFAQEQFAMSWYFIVSLVVGFGIQIALFRHIKNLVASGAGMGKVVGASGATSSLAMVSCCAHYLVNLLPVLGVTGVVTFVAQYQTGLFWVGILANVVGIGYMLKRINSITHP
jgi:hypothetical protein